MGQAGVLVFFSMMMISFSSFGEEREIPMSVNPSASGEAISNVPASGNITRSWKKDMVIKIHNSCYGTNLRQTSNPLAPSSIIHADLQLKVGTETYDIKVKYPAAVVTHAGMTNSGNKISPMDSSLYSISKGSQKIDLTAGIYGNTIVLKTAIPSTASVGEAGGISTTTRTVELVGKSFVQEVTNCNGGPVYGSYGHSSHTATYACGDYMGKNGPLTTTDVGGISNDQSQIEFSVSFPGETGFCGGYWSPLMLFFSDARPQFNNVSDFPLIPGLKTMWPEKGAPGFFLALDRDHSGKIDKKDELFGDNKTQENGFEVLKKLDSNNDGYIDKNDSVFKDLVLWNDVNGDGKSQKKELSKLSLKVERISLNYNDKKVEPLGKFAEARQFSSFTFKSDGKIKEGEVIDIWLAPAHELLSQK